MDVLDGSLGELRIKSSESFAANILVIGTGKVPRELDGGLLHGRLSSWLDVLHLDVLDRNREGFKAEAKGFGCGWLHFALLDVVNISLLVGDEVGGRGKVSGDAGPSAAGGILERRRDGSQLDRRDILR